MAELTTIPTQYGFADQGFLAEGLRPGVTTCQIAPIYRIENGVRTPRGFNTPAAFIYIELAGEYERASYGVATVDPVTKITTLTDMRRDLSQTNGNDFTSQGDGGDWPKGSRVVVSNDPALFGSYALVGAANVFTEINTFEDKVQLTDANTYIDLDGSGNLIFKDTNNALRTLTDISSSGSNDKTGVSTDDTTPDYLENKIVGGDGVAVTVDNPAGDEELSLAVVLATDPGLEFDSGALQIKVKPDSGITVDSDGIGHDGSGGSVTPLIASTGLSSVVTDTTTETTITGTGYTYTIPSNTLSQGDFFTIKTGGLIKTPNGQTSTLRFKVSGSTLCDLVVTNSTGATSNSYIGAEVNILVRSIGVSGKMDAFVVTNANTMTNLVITNPNQTGSAGVTVDTTGDLTFTITAQNSTSGSAGAHACQLYLAHFMKVNSAT